jgi:probable F420-dependent oxidoreductase
VKLGIRTPGDPCSGEGAARIAVAAEELGFHSIWVSEHVVHPELIQSRHPFGEYRERLDRAFPEMMVALGYMAAVTETLRLGTGVVPIVTRHPLFLANQAATLDALSGGRLELGLGAGWLWEEAAALGQATDRPNDRLAETIDILRTAWSERSFAFYGEFWSFDAVAVSPRPAQGAEVPIWIGGSSNAAVRIARSKGAGLLPAGLAPAQVEEFRGRAGADVPVGTLVWFADGAITAEGETGSAGEMARAYEAAGTDLLVAVVASGTDPRTVVAEMERFVDSALV